MSLIDFHHHKPFEKSGIYNLASYENAPARAFSAGIHPAEAPMDSAKRHWLDSAAQSQYCTAIGECGLDARLEHRAGLQEECFKEQIKIANELRKPLVVHCVRQFGRLLHFSRRTTVPLVIHGYNRDQKLATQLLDAGFYLSFGKAALHSVSLQQVIKNMPLNRIFLETDDADVEISALYQNTAIAKNIPLRDLEAAIEENFDKIINL